VSDEIDGSELTRTERQGSRIIVQGSRIIVQGSRIIVQGSGCRVEALVQGLSFREDSEIRV